MAFDAPWFSFFVFLLFSFGIYERLTIVRAWWELRKLSPDLIKEVDKNFSKFEMSLDPMAHKLRLLRRFLSD
jgi:hypothetical protein